MEKLHGYKHPELGFYCVKCYEANDHLFRGKGESYNVTDDLLYIFGDLKCVSCGKEAKHGR